MSTNRVYRVAVIPGDGIGKEVVPEGIRVLEAAGKRFGFEVRQDWFDFASYDYYAKHDRMMPEDWKERIGQHDAIFFGAVGWPEKIPDHISLWGSLILFRREFDQYVNLRPVRLMPGVPSPLAGRKPGDIDFWVVRENTEGEYSSIGGRMFAGTEREVVIQETVMSRVGVDRVLRFAFDLASERPKKHLTSATKSNGISITMPYWDERVKEMAKSYPGVRWDQYHIDILSAHFVLNPDRFFGGTSFLFWPPRPRGWPPPAPQHTFPFFKRPPHIRGGQSGWGGPGDGGLRAFVWGGIFPRGAGGGGGGGGLIFGSPHERRPYVLLP